MPAVTSLTRPQSDRDIRMLTTLLSSCDPCKRIAHGGSAVDYIDPAAEIALTLRAGGGVTDVLLVLTEAEVEAAHRFACVAVHWWNNRLAAGGRSAEVL